MIIISVLSAFVKSYFKKPVKNLPPLQSAFNYAITVRNIEVRYLFLLRSVQQAGLDEALIHATASHGWGLACDVKPEHEMEKVLFACDELTGLIGAAALMRPSKSCTDMELKSLKKKFKDKKFAAGCSREVIAQGADLLGWELDKLLDVTLQAMQDTEAAVQAQLT